MNIERSKHLKLSKKSIKSLLDAIKDQSKRELFDDYERLQSNSTETKSREEIKSALLGALEITDFKEALDVIRTDAKFLKEIQSAELKFLEEKRRREKRKPLNMLDDHNTVELNDEIRINETNNLVIPESMVKIRSTGSKQLSGARLRGKDSSARKILFSDRRLTRSNVKARADV